MLGIKQSIETTKKEFGSDSGSGGGGGTTDTVLAVSSTAEGGSTQQVINTANQTALSDLNTKSTALRTDVDDHTTKIAKNEADITKNVQDIIASEDRITITEQDIATASQERNVLNTKVEELRLDHDIIFQDADATVGQVLSVKTAIDTSDPNSKLQTEWKDGSASSNPYFGEWLKRVFSYFETRPPSDPTDRFVSTTGQVKLNSVAYDDSHQISPTVGFSGHINSVPGDYIVVKVLSDKDDHVGIVQFDKGSKPILRMAYDHTHEDGACVLVVIRIIDKSNNKTIAESTPTKRSSPDESEPYIIGGYDQPWVDGSSKYVYIPLEGVDKFISTPEARKSFELQVCLEKFNSTTGTMYTEFYNEKENPMTYYHQTEYADALNRTFAGASDTIPGSQDRIYLNPIYVDFTQNRVIKIFNDDPLYRIFQLNASLPAVYTREPLMLNHEPMFIFKDNDVASPISSPKFNTVHSQLLGFIGNLNDTVYGYKMGLRINSSYDQVGDYKIYMQIDKNGTNIYSSERVITLTSEEITYHSISVELEGGYKNIVSADNVNFIIHFQKTIATQPDIAVYNNVNHPLYLFRGGF